VNKPKTSFIQAANKPKQNNAHSRVHIQEIHLLTRFALSVKSGWEPTTYSELLFGPTHCQWPTRDTWMCISL